MSHKKDTVWDAPPHTIAKIALVRDYLYVWLSILGSTFSRRDVWYIDGFAGPGEYTNYEDGSPVAALKAADQARSLANWVAGDIHCVFIEDDARRFANLEDRLNKIPAREGVKRHSYCETFVDGINRLRREKPNPFESRSPIFAFIDPFGARGLAFSVVRELLSRQACEVLINLDSDGIGRIYRAGHEANHRERLNEVFGDAQWEAELTGVRQADMSSTVLAMYKRRLRTILNVRYCFAFGMLSTGDHLDYHLVFASQHPRGLEKMKEQMRKISGNGTYTFSDAHVGQTHLFRFDEPEHHAPEMAMFFAGRAVPYAQVNDYALNESPFTNPKKMLKYLETDNRITVASANSARRKGQYPDEMQAGIMIRFPP